MIVRPPRNVDEIPKWRDDITTLLKDIEATLANLPTDDSTGAFEIVEYEHHEVHSGSAYAYEDFYLLAKNASKDFLIITPDTTKWGHFTLGVEALSNTVAWYLYEDTEVSSNGTSEPVYNRNRNSTKTNTLLLYEDPVVTTPGTELKSGILGAGRGSIGGKSRDSREVVLKQNTNYLIRVTEQNIGSTNVNLSLDWYEHTDKA